MTSPTDKPASVEECGRLLTTLTLMHITRDQSRETGGQSIARNNEFAAMLMDIATTWRTPQEP